jgi:hypothetical protein
LRLATLRASVPPIAARGAGREEAREENDPDDEQDPGNDAHPGKAAVEPAVSVSILGGGHRREDSCGF